MRFSVRSVMVAVAGIALLIKSAVEPAQRQHIAVGAIGKWGDCVVYDVDQAGARKNKWQTIVANTLGKDYAGTVVAVRLRPSFDVYRRKVPTSGPSQASFGLEPYNLDHNVSNGDLAVLRGLREVRRLSLSWTDIDDRGLEHIRDLRRLRFLDLSYTNVGDQGIAHLQRLPQLQYLLLVGTNITDGAIVNLRSLHHLEQLWVDDTLISAAGITELERELPGCRVFVQVSRLRGEKGSSDRRENGG